jgi:hypothetical protein
MTRVINIDEVPKDRLEWMGNSFFSEGGLPGKFHVEHFITVWRNLLNSGMGALWLAEADGKLFGGIGGILYPTMFSPQLSAVETFWYVEPNSRGGTCGIRLHKEFETWAALRGAKTVTMVHINGLMPDSLARYYMKHNYKPFETCYIKEL